MIRGSEDMSGEAGVCRLSSRLSLRNGNPSEAEAHIIFVRAPTYGLEARTLPIKPRGGGMLSVDLGCVQIGQAFGQRHLDEARGQIELAEIAFREGDEDFTRSGFENEKRNRAGGAVDGDNCADSDGRGAGDVEERAADEIADVGLVVSERDALGEGNGYEQASERFGSGDGVDAGEMQYDAALVQPVVDEFGRARRRRRVRTLVEEAQVAALGELVGKVSEDVGEDFAFASLGAADARQGDPLTRFRRSSLSRRWTSRGLPCQPNLDDSVRSPTACILLFVVFFQDR